jgi:hypothetical protein
LPKPVGDSSQFRGELPTTDTNAIFMDAPALHCYTATRPHGYTATRLHGYTATRLHGYTATRRHGYTATRRHGYTATRRHGYTAPPSHDDALLFFSDGCFWFFVKYLQDGFTIIQTHASRTQNLRFYFVHASTKPRFLAKKRHQKSGIPCSARDDMTMRWFFSDGCVCIGVKYLQDGFTIIQTHAMT